ncbi:MAG: BatD family protein, partial [Fidelibacterota bacterium]
MLRYIYILLMGLTLGYAAQTQVRVTVDRNKIYEGDSVTLTISVEDGNGYPQLDISEITDFQIISGPNQSSNMQWV